MTQTQKCLRLQTTYIINIDVLSPVSFNFFPPFFLLVHVTNLSLETSYVCSGSEKPRLFAGSLSCSEAWRRFAIMDHSCLTQQILLKAFPFCMFIKLQPWQSPNTQNTLKKGKYLRRKSQHIRYVVLEWHVTGTEEFDSKNTCLPPHSC